MVFKGLVTAVAAAALAVSPTMAAAQIAPAGESVGGSALQSDNRGVSNRPFPFVTIAAILAAGFGLCVAFNICIDDDENEQVTPG